MGDVEHFESIRIVIKDIILSQDSDAMIAVLNYSGSMALLGSFYAAEQIKLMINELGSFEA